MRYSIIIALLIFVALFTLSCSTDRVSEKQIMPAQYNAKQTMSAADIYSNTRDDVFLLETDCKYDLIYDDFNVNSYFDAYSEEIEINVDPVYKKNIIRDSAIMSGSGFLFENELYTNYHVLDCDEKEQEETIRFIYELVANDYYLGYEIEESLINDMLPQDIDLITNKVYNNLERLSGYQYEIDKSEIKQYIIARIFEYLSERITVSETSKTIRAFHEADNFAKSVPLKIKRRGDSFPGRDFAVLHLPNSKNGLKTKERQLITGEKIYVIGFPMIKEDPEEYEDQFIPKIQKEPPLITQGIISRSTKYDGITYYVIDAAAYYGSSGGPVIDEKGKVIGILTAGLMDGTTINYMLPISEIN